MADVGIKTSTRPSASTLVPLQRRAHERSGQQPGRRIEPGLPDAPAASTTALPLQPSRPSTRLPDAARLMGGDLFAAATTAVVAWELGAVAVVAAVPVMAASGLYSRRFSPSVLDDAPRLLRATALLVATFLLVCVAGAVSVAQVALASALYLGAAFLVRGWAYHRLRTLRRAGDVTYPVLLVGDEKEEMSRRIAAHPETGLRVAGAADAGGVVTHPDGSTETVTSLMRRDHVTDVIVHPGCAGPATSAWVRRVAWREVALHVMVPEVGAAPRHGWDDHVWGVPLLRMQTTLRWRRARLLKRLTDIVVSSTALLMLAPLLALVALLVRREVGPKVFFRQERVGLEGNTFEVLKFRSMRDLPAGVTSPWSVTSSDRIGPVGRFIRKYSIDELPQLLNVLRGEMSLVGPRPERPEYVRKFTAQFPHYEFRHRAPVGLTGLAAVEGLRGNTSIHDRAYFDNLYVETWSYWADVKIIARTVLSVVQGTGS